MKTYAICPISNKRIDENVARINGLITVILLSSYIISSSIIMIVFLSIDFLLRSIELTKYSPIAFISKKMAAGFALKPTPINAGPKIFAARIGFIFTTIVLVSHILGFETTALIFTTIFAFCALLEAAIGFCVACQIYPLIYKLTTNKKTTHA